MRAGWAASDVQVVFAGCSRRYKHCEQAVQEFSSVVPAVPEREAVCAG